MRRELDRKAHSACCVLTLSITKEDLSIKLRYSVDISFKNIELSMKTAILMDNSIKKHSCPPGRTSGWIELFDKIQEFVTGALVLEEDAAES